MQLNTLMSRFALVSLFVSYALAITPNIADKSVSPFHAQRRSSFKPATGSASHRRLVSARHPDSDIRRDLVQAFLKHDHVLYFIEGQKCTAFIGVSCRNEADEPPWHQERLWQPQSQFAAHVQLSSHLPTSLLEDNDAHFKHAICYASTIKITFHSIAAVTATWQEMKGHPELLVIKSHLGCNSDGERKPFLYVMVSILSFRKDC